MKEGGSGEREGCYLRKKALKEGGSGERETGRSGGSWQRGGLLLPMPVDGECGCVCVCWGGAG